MRPSFRPGKGSVAALVAVALLITGSIVYWLAEGRPPTPEDFRDRVADAGLDVAWSNSGPRGGSGVVDTACGPVEVTVTEMEDQLWIRWAERREPATREAIDALLSCGR